MTSWTIGHSDQLRVLSWLLGYRVELPDLDRECCAGLQWCRHARSCTIVTPRTGTGLRPGRSTSQRAVRTLHHILTHASGSGMVFGGDFAASRRANIQKLKGYLSRVV